MSGPATGAGGGVGAKARAQEPRIPAAHGVTPTRVRDAGELRARRRHARRNRRLARIDLAVGAGLGLILLLAAPGLAIVALVALAALAVTLGSLLLGALRRRRAGRPLGRPGAREGPTAGPL